MTPANENTLSGTTVRLETNPGFWRWTTTVSLLVGYIGYYLCRGNLSAAFPLLGRELHFSNTDLGLIAFWSEATYAAGKFVTGPVGDRIGGKALFLVGMIGAIAMNIAFGMSSTLPAFIAVWCVCRFFLSAGWNGIVPIVARWHTPATYGRVMGFLSLSFQLGGAIATAFAGILISQGMGWRQLFFVPAAVLAVIFLACLFLIREPSEADRASPAAAGAPVVAEKASFVALLKEPAFASLLAFSFFTTFLRSVFLAWTPKILSDIGLGDTQAIFKSALFPLLGAVSTILLGVWSDRKLSDGGWGLGKVLAGMLAALVASLVACAYLVNQGPEAASAVGWMIGLSGFFLLGPYSMAAGRLSLDVGGPARCGSCAGFVDGVGYIGGVAALALAGVGADRWGWANILLILAGFAVISIGSALYLGWSLDRRPAKA